MPPCADFFSLSLGEETGRGGGVGRSISLMMTYDFISISFYDDLSLYKHQLLR